MNLLRHQNPPAATTTASDEAIFTLARETESPPLPQEAAGEPAGRFTHGRHLGVKAFPGVGRNYSVYLPAGVDAGGELALLVFQDGGFYTHAEKFRAPAMLDALVGAGEIPPLVALFVEPGDLPGNPDGSRGNRSVEYDTLSAAYVSLLLDELLPEALAGLNVSADPARRAICGMSSGGICAFNAAWERPDAFGRVLSHCGSFTNIRGGHVVASRVRAAAPKPLRVLLQSGAADFDKEAGSWAVANFDMAAALALKGYDYRFEFGLGGHDLRHGAATFAASLRWLWR
jgi:enterochelin esterase-like enzyme